MLLHILAKICIVIIMNIGDVIRKNLRTWIHKIKTPQIIVISYIAWAMRIFTFSSRTAMAGDFPNWQEGICSEHTCSFQGSFANDYSDFQNLKTFFGICLNSTATQPLPLEAAKELVTYVFVYPPVNVPCIFYRQKEPGDSDTISVWNSPSTWEQLHTFHHVREKIITTCAVWEHEAKRRHCTYHHPHKNSAIFPSTYLECKIKQIKATLHNLAFTLYQIAHNCNHKMIILCHMCICRAGSGTDRPRPRQKWCCGATLRPLRALPLPGQSGAPGQALGVHFLTEKHRFEMWKTVVQSATQLPQITLCPIRRGSHVYVKHSSLGQFAVLAAGLCEN